MSVLLEAADDTEVELYVSYVVHGASWSPKYDIRVFSGENKLKVVTEIFSEIISHHFQSKVKFKI